MQFRFFSKQLGDGFVFRAVTESVNRLIDICTSGAPWQKECDNAIRTIQSVYRLLDNPVEPVNEFSYFECLEVVTEKSKVNCNVFDCVKGAKLVIFAEFGRWHDWYSAPCQKW